MITKKTKKLFFKYMYGRTNIKFFINKCNFSPVVYIIRCETEIISNVLPGQETHMSCVDASLSVQT